MEKSQCPASVPANLQECRALSLRSHLWQSPAGDASYPAMLRITTFAAFLCALSVSNSVSAVPGGELGTLPLGRYVCELPGDAAGPSRRHVPAEDFRIVSASSYTSGDVLGSYLLIGKEMRMTSGPHRGNRYRLVSKGFLRKIKADDKPGDLRCVRATRNNS